MEEKMEAALVAINKWMYFGWNYKIVSRDKKNWDGYMERESVPEFLLKVKWTCNIEHMIGKWKAACSYGTPDGYLPRFYAELDQTNRALLIEWVMKNYNDEIKIV